MEGLSTGPDAGSRSGAAGFHRLVVFAVEDTAVQLAWATRPRDEIVLRAGDAEVHLEEGHGPGAVVLEPLPPDTDVVVSAAVGGRHAHEVLRVRTLAPPPGERLGQIATINDLHVGARHFGTLRPLRDAPDAELRHPERCATAAIAEANAWGAQLLVVKGDLTQHGRREQLDHVAALLAAAPMPVIATVGNHDVQSGDAEPATEALAGAGVPAAIGGALLRDVPGLRIVLADTTIPGRHHGQTAAIEEEILDLVRGSTAGSFLALHHYAQRWRISNTWPPGVPGPEASRFLDQLADTQPATFVTSGHTHRHRRHRHGPLHLSEIGSTKDYPGTWAGYAIHEGGIRQVVRRVAEPEAIAWTEATRRVLGGIWGLWSPGPITDRCFSVAWPPSRAG